MRKMRFKCPRCFRLSVGRQFHTKCFDAVWREEQLIKNAMKKQAVERTDDKIRREQSVIMQSKKRLAVQRGVNRNSYDEIENAEAFWTEMMRGRSFS